MDYIKEQVNEQVVALKGLWANKRQVRGRPAWRPLRALAWSWPR